MGRITAPMRFALALLAVFVLAGCAEAADDADGGIEGVAMMGPTCPGPERDPPEPGCEDRPYEGSLEARTSPGGRVVKMFHTAPDGSFRFAIASGTYVVGTPATSTKLPTCSSQTVEVTAGAYATVVVTCDTGIR